MQKLHLMLHIFTIRQIYSTTHTALILPGKERESKIHFKMDPIFNLTNKEIIITEEYLNIREIIDFYISS